MTSGSIPFRSWVVLLAVGVLVFLLNIDYTAVNLVLVPVSEEIHADLNDLQWLLSAYVLVWAAFVIPGGRIADFYGKQNTLIASLLLFMVGSVLTGLGRSIEVLIIGRIVQGCGAAIFTGPSWALVFKIASPAKQGFVMGIILCFAGFGLATGPTLAGIIIEELSWRWIFYINIPLVLFVIIILKLYVGKERLPQVEEKIDFAGALFLGVGLSILMYTLNEIEILGAKSLQIWGGFGFGILLIGIHVRRDRLRKVRLIPPYLFCNKSFMVAACGNFFMAMNFSMTLVLTGLYLQNTLNYSSYETGLIFISMTISMGLLSPIGGKIIDAFGVKVPMVSGALLAACGLGISAFLGTNSSLFHITFALFLIGTGLGTYFTGCNTAMMRSVPSEDLNVASGVYTMFIMIGNTLSVILATSFVVLFGKQHLLHMALEKGLAFSPEQYQNLVNVISQVEHSASQLKDFPPEQTPQLLGLVNEAFVYGFSLNMMAGTCFALIAASLTIWGLGNLKVSPVQAPAAI